MKADYIIKWLLIIFLLSPLAYQLLTKTRVDPADVPGNPLDGCHHVYLDLGTNTGVQIRKLFESHKFPSADVLPIFDKYFGSVTGRNISKVCAVGFEPNPDHEPNLRFLSSLYNRCGWRNIIHTRTAVASKTMDTKFARIDLDYDYVDGLYWILGVAGRLVDTGVPQNDTTEVKAIRIADYINNIVATRKIPESHINASQAAVVMKLDVEGKELEIMADLVMSGALKHVDNIHVDWSTDPYSDIASIEKMRKAIGFITQVAKDKNLSHIAEVEDTDDESYASFTGDYPQC